MPTTPSWDCPLFLSDKGRVRLVRARYMGIPVALARNGDTITLDPEKRSMTLSIPSAEFKKRKKAWKKPSPHYTRGALARYRSFDECLA